MSSTTASARRPVDGGTSMNTFMLVRRSLAATFASGIALLLAVSVGQAATPAPCRVRNVNQSTSGRSLIRMVEHAGNGDRLQVRGTCRGEIVIDSDIAVRGFGDAVLTGRDRARVVRVKKGAKVTLRDLVITRGARVVSGAGIANDGNLTLLNVIVKRNHARAMADGFPWGFGGGIANSGRLLLEDSA